MKTTLYSLDEPRLELSNQTFDYKYDVCKTGMLGTEPEELFDTERWLKDLLEKAGYKPEKYEIPNEPKYGSYLIYSKDTHTPTFEAELHPGAEFKCLEPLHSKEIDNVMLDHMAKVKWMGLFIDEKGKSPEDCDYIKVSHEGMNQFSDYFIENKDKTDDEHVRWRQIECLLRENAKDKQHIKLHPLEQTDKGTRVELQYSGECPHVPITPKTTVVNWDSERLAELSDKWLPVTLMCMTNDGELIDGAEHFGKKLEEIDEKYEADMNEWHKVAERADYDGRHVLTHYLEEKYGPNYEYMLVNNGCGDEIGFEKTPLPSDEDIPPMTEEERIRDEELAEEMARLEAEENARREFTDEDLFNKILADEQKIEDEEWMNNCLQDLD